MSLDLNIIYYTLFDEAPLEPGEKEISHILLLNKHYKSDGQGMCLDLWKPAPHSNQNQIIN